MNSEKLARLQAQARIGGKGTARRKYKAVRTNTSSDSGKVLTTLRRMGGNPITEIEEVNMFRDDGNVIHFAKPQVHGAPNANTFVISGNSEEKKIQDLLPGIINQLGPDSLNNIKQLVESLSKNAGKDGEAPAKEGEDDEVPELVENF